MYPRTLLTDSEENSIPIQRLSTTSLLNHLYSLGVISFEQVDDIRKLQKIRNQIIHGFQLQLKKSDITLAHRLIDTLLETFSKIKKY